MTPADTSDALAGMRRHYTMDRLSRDSLHANPITQFERWLAEAVEAKLIEPNAMTLATADAEGRPLVRTVLLKSLDARGFVFFTNLESRKAAHIAVNPEVSTSVLVWVQDNPLEAREKPATRAASLLAVLRSRATEAARAAS